jgi:hypothetical protein
MEAVNTSENGLIRYGNGNWQKAIGTFREALEINPGDSLPGIYIERCEHLRKIPRTSPGTTSGS